MVYFVFLNIPPYASFPNNSSVYHMNLAVPTMQFPTVLRRFCKMIDPGESCGYPHLQRSFPDHWVFGYVGGRRWQLKRFLFSPRTLGKISNLTDIFQMGWNHQLVFNYNVFWTIFLSDQFTLSVQLEMKSYPVSGWILSISSYKDPCCRILQRPSFHGFRNAIARV